MELTKQAGRVRLTRSLEQDENGKDAVIWTKTYQGNRTDQSGVIDLSVFNAWERTLILKAHDDGLNSCYRMAHLIEKGSGLHTDDTPDNARQTRTTVIKTHHTGADLDIWRVMRPWSQGSLLEHPFVKQQHFLKLIRGILFALHGFHSKRFVHCDLHPGNIVLPAEIKQLHSNSGEGDRYQLIARWDQIKLIDLGYSIHQGIEAPAMLPLALWEMANTNEYRRDAAGEKIPSRRMSPHLHGRLKTLDAIASKWPASETFGRQRWQQHQVQLKILQELDWREDMYQLGYWLAKIRDGDEDGSWGDVRYVGDVINIREVNAFISNFPEELMKWGQESDLPGEMPHIGYIKRINDLVSALPAVPDTFTLHRRDYDTAYKTYIEVIPNRENTSLDDASWKQACSIDSAESYAHYLAEWPYGFSAHEAQSRMSKRQTNHVQQIHSQRLPLWTALNRSATRLAQVALAVLVLAGLSWAFLNRPAPAITATQAPVAAVDSLSAAMAAYSAQTAAIEKSDWWTKGRSLNLVATAEQTKWVADTVTHATKDHWPRAQFALAGLYCSGAHPALVPLSTSDCGQWMATALQNPLTSSPQTSIAERERILFAVVAAFDDIVMGYSQGKFHNMPPEHDFARALLPGLQHVQSEHPGLALRAAYVQACNLVPAQRSAATQTLQMLLTRHADRPEATQANKWLAEWRAEDFGRCRIN